MPPTPSGASLQYGVPYSIWQAIISFWQLTNFYAKKLALTVNIKLCPLGTRLLMTLSFIHIQRQINTIAVRNDQYFCLFLWNCLDVYHLSGVINGSVGTVDLLKEEAIIIKQRLLISNCLVVFHRDMQPVHIQYMHSSIQFSNA